MKAERQGTILYISHGGGPLPLLGDPGHREMVDNLRKLGEELPRPSVIVVISAHWEEPRPTVTSGAAPDLIYDYSGFPPESYAITYPAAGSPGLAKAIFSRLQAAGFKPQQDGARGFDHGLFVPLKIMFPKADIPCVQLSLVSGLDPELHLRMGEALADLQYEDVLIIGSGFSFHNMRAFFTPETAETAAMNQAFDNWLLATCADSRLPEAERRQRLVDWERAPHARYCHPREEHLLPLHVCYGMAGRACSSYYRLQILGKRASVYLW